MEQGIVDWTAFLDDDAWFLPEPPPAGTGLINEPRPGESNENTQDLCEQPPLCEKHPTPSPDCCRLQLPADPFMGFEVPPLGHFGVGFPDGHYPETVPGSFTATEVELGQRWSIFDDELFPDPRKRARKAAPQEEAAVKSPLEDEWPRDFSSEMLDEVQFPQEVDDLPEIMTERAASTGIESVSAQEQSDSSESTSSFDGGKPESVTTEECSPTIVEDLSFEAQETIQRHEPSTHAQEQIPPEELGAVPAANVDSSCTKADDMESQPKQHWRKRKTPKSSEFIGPCDSDSDYTPDPRKKKKKPRVAHAPGVRTKRTTAIQPMKAKTGANTVWYSQPKSSTKPRAKLKDAPARPREAEAQKKAVTEYAIHANRAKFAASATRARFALRAAVILPNLCVQYGGAMVDAQELALAFPGLDDKFENFKAGASAGKGPVPKAEEARFADSAGDALIARVAKAAQAVIQVG